jgi:hypothetical protein
MSEYIYLTSVFLSFHKLEDHQDEGAAYLTVAKEKESSRDNSYAGFCSRTIASLEI